MGANKGATNEYALICNNPCKKYLEYRCIDCNSKDIRPIRLFSEKGKNRGTFWECKTCGKINKLKKEVLHVIP